MVELLAPAGDRERLEIALLYGADAVYIGGPMLGLRANAINFTIEGIKDACSFAHSLNKLVYVTVNIVLHNIELSSVEDYLKSLKECKVDAIIASDPSVIDIAINKVGIPVHLSTQASNLNLESTLFYKNLGVERVVLAREAKRDEIKDIIDISNVDVECFIHGAMCSGMSGRCVLSNYFTNRDANRGGCSQVCRWDFDLYSEDNNKLEGIKPFTFCAKDLSMVKYIKDMIDIGITSLKIEGRMRSIYYIATVVGTYRKIIDSIVDGSYVYNEEDDNLLRRCANRDSCEQFYISDSHNSNYYNGRNISSNQDFLGIIIDYDKESKIATIEERNYFEKGDKTIIFSPFHKDIEYTFDEIIDEEDNIIDIVRHPKQIVRVKIEGASKFDLIRKKVL